MPLSVDEDKGVTVVTMATDDLSSWCETLRDCCSGPTCWSVNRELMRSSVVTALGTVQILVGVFNIGLGPQRTEAYPFWLGALFITAGVVSVLADMFPLPCLVGFSAFVNIVGSVLAIVGVVLYAVHLASFTTIWMCGSNNHDTNDNNCTFLANLAQKLLRGVDITMIVASVLQLCVSISLAVLGLKSLCYRGRDKGIRDVEIQQPRKRSLHGQSWSLKSTHLNYTHLSQGRGLEDPLPASLQVVQHEQR